MKLFLIAVGKKMPDWVTTAFNEYNKRLPDELKLQLREVTPAQRNKSSNTETSKADEMLRINAALSDKTLTVVLDENGKQFSSVELSTQINDWQHDGRDVALIIGGADGLAEELLQSADLKWSLSKLTLPHTLVRAVLAEQIYRAWTILNNHPYHRE